MENTEKRHPLLVELAGENARIASLRNAEEGYAGRIETVTARIEGSRKRLQQLREEQPGLRERVETTGLTPSLGLLLRVRLGELPSLRLLRRQIAERRNQIAAVQLAVIELEEKRSALADLDLAVVDRLRAFQPPLSPEERQSLHAPARALIEEYSGNLDALIRDAGTYLVRLVDLDAVERQLLAETEHYRQFIFENILWIRSTPILDFRNLLRGLEGIARTLHPRRWREIGAGLLAGWHTEPLLPFSLIFLALLLLALRPRLLAGVLNCGGRENTGAVDGLACSLEAVGWTLALVLPLPLLAYLAGHLLLSAPGGEDFPQLLGTGLQKMAPVLLGLLFVQDLLRPGGPAERQWRWQSARVLALARRLLFWLTLIAVPLQLLHGVVSGQGPETTSENAGRLVLIIALLLLSTLCHHFFRPRGQATALLQELAPQSFAVRHRLAFYPLLVGAPLLLACLAALGWLYTAEQLALRGLRSLALLALALFAWFLGLHLIRLSRRSLARIQHSTLQEWAGDLTEPAIHEIGLQARRVMGALILVLFLLGLSSIWLDMLPALRGFYAYPLWTTTVKGPVLLTSDGGAASPALVDQETPVTVLDLLLFLLILALTMLLTRNMPGFLDFTLLRRLPLDHGLRFAIRTVSGYAITIFGLLLAFARLGIGWEKVQWLAAAVSVGLGFGLQEIFANFVSGLILLFERPLRVGDVVSVGEMTGEVSRVQIRATTITDWDNREVVIPNKEFITGRLTNWTLSSSVVRFVFQVGVAYGTDTDQVTRILEQIAREHPDVLDEPAPVVVFNRFGDSSLDFELRVYKEGLGRFPAFRHSINSQINRAFQREGISIPFPQRDLHLKSVEPLHLVPARERPVMGNGNTVPPG